MRTGPVLGTGYWALGTGNWALGTGYWALVTGHWVLGTWVLDTWVLGTRYWVLGSGCWVLGTWVLGTGCWVLGTGYWVQKALSVVVGLVVRVGYGIRIPGPASTYRNRNRNSIRYSLDFEYFPYVFFLWGWYATSH